MSGGVVALEPFLPDAKPVQPRPDNNLDASINWVDDDDAIAFTLAQERSSFGAALVPRATIERIGSAVHGGVFLERATLPDNRYHGNLVYSGGMEKALRRRVADAIALQAEYIQPPTRS